LTCDNVFPEIGSYGARPLWIAQTGVAQTGGGWQASCKLPPGLAAGWHTAKLRVENSRFSAPLQFGIDVALSAWQSAGSSVLQITRVADGKVFEDNRVRVGDDSAISVWVAGLPANTSLADISLRLNGTDLPAIWLAPPGDARQINALLPAGLEPGDAAITVVFRNSETHQIKIELHR
jgi:hypothetical protein